MAHDQQTILQDLRACLGRKNVLTSSVAKRPFITGWRYGSGDALAVVRPETLVAYWRALKVAVAHDCIVIMQAANTGLTGGSTPWETYDRPVIVINTTRMDGIYPLKDGKQVICLPGARLNELEKRLDPYGRDPHSVIGSSCIGASVVGGVCNNSGGALVRRGPVYTEMALYAQLDAQGALELVNHLGLPHDGDDESLLARLDRGDFNPEQLTENGVKKASADDYEGIVRDISASTPARFNADPNRLYETSGCAGKLAVFAVRLDTFEKPRATQMIYIAAKTSATLTRIRQTALKDLDRLPISAEYLDHSAYRIAKTYGKDTVLAIKALGERRIPQLFETKAKIDGFFKRLSEPLVHLSDHILQALARIAPNHLPGWMDQFHAAYRHHLLLKVEGDMTGSVRSLLDRVFEEEDGAYHLCTDADMSAAMLHRFAAAGASMRVAALKGKKAGGIAALDVAMPRNSESWDITFPQHILDQVEDYMVYGHFFCHVFHLDFVLKAGVNLHDFEAQVLEILEDMGAEYPAEHNVGHLYEAKPDLADFYQNLDPTNSFNPGIGKTSRCKHWH